MIPRRLSGKNIECYNFFDLDFTSSNVFSIVGKFNSNLNKSNGAGKSAIFRAIVFALFGYTTCNLDDIVRFGQTQAEVSFEFELNGSIFKIERSRKIINKNSKSELKLSEWNGSKWESLTQKTNSETEEEIFKLIKMNFLLFRNSIYFSQEDFKNISNVKSAQERKQLFKEIYNLVIWSFLEKIQKEKNATINKQIVALTATIDVFGNIEDQILKIESSLKNENELLLKYKKDQNDSLLKLNLLNENLFLLKNKIPSSFDDLYVKLEDLRNSKRNIQCQLNNTNKTLFSKEKEFLDKKNIFDETVKELKSLKDSLEIEKKKRFRDKEKIKEDVKNGYALIATINAEIEKINSKIEELINPLPNSQICPACRQPLTQEHLEKCKEEILIKNAEFSERKKEFLIQKKNIEENNKKVQKEFDDFEENEKLKITLFSKIENKKNEIKNQQDVAKQLNQFIERVRSDISSISENINSISIKENELKNLIQSSNTEEIKKEIDQTNIEIEKNKKDQIEYLQQVSKSETKIEFLSKDLDKLKIKLKELNELLEKRDVLQKEYKIKLEVAKSFHPNGIPTDIIQNELPTLEKETNKILSMIRPEIQIEFKVSEDNESIDIINKINRKNLSSTQLSHGQGFIVDLATMIGQAEVMRTNFGVNVGFLLFDEVDQGIDQEACENLVKLINVLKTTYKIFIITHNDWIKEQFKSCIVVNGDDINGSTATLEIND